MSDINDQELERLLKAARDLLNKSRSYGPTTDEERQARSLINKAKKFAMATRNADLRMEWTDLNYQLKGVKVRKPVPNLNRGFQGVHDPRSYGSGGLADSHEPDGDDIQEATDSNLVYRMDKAEDRACTYFSQEACGLAVRIGDLLRAGKKEEGLKMLQDPKNKGLLPIIPREVRSWFGMTVSDSYRPDGEEMSEQSGRMASIAAAAKKIGSGSKQSAPKQSGSFAAFFKTKEDSTFATNALRFRTKEEAEAYARSLFMRWLGASEWKVMPHTDKPNYEIVNNELRAIKETFGEANEDHDDWLMIKPKFDEMEKVLKTSKSQSDIIRKLKNLASVVATLGGIQDEGGKFAKEIRDIADGIDELEQTEIDAGYWMNDFLTDLRVTRNRIQRFIEVQRRVEDSYHPSGDTLSEDDWGGGFQDGADAHREVQAGLKRDFQRERAQKLKWVVQVIRGEITKQKFRKLAGISYDELMNPQFKNWYINQVKRMSKKALAPVNPPAPAAPTTESADIQEKVEIDGRTRAYRNTVMRLEQARRLRGGKGTEMQENKFGGLYDDGSGKGAFIPAPVDFNFQEAMRIVEKYRTLREKKKTLFGAPKDKMEDLNAAITMKNGKFVMDETEMSPKQKEYRKFFDKALKKFGKDSPADMDGAEKKKFFDWIKNNWKG